MVLKLWNTYWEPFIKQGIQVESHQKYWYHCQSSQNIAKYVRCFVANTFATIYLQSIPFYKGLFWISDGFGSILCRHHGLNMFKKYNRQGSKRKICCKILASLAKKYWKVWSRTTRRLRSVSKEKMLNFLLSLFTIDLA